MAGVEAFKGLFRTAEGGAKQAFEKCFCGFIATRVNY